MLKETSNFLSGLSQKPSVSLILNYESVVTDLTAKYAHTHILLMTATGGSDGGSSGDSSMDLNMVPGSSRDHGHQHGL